MVSDELHNLTIERLSKRIRDQSISPVELVVSQFERIRQFADLHAYALLMEDSALAEARAAESEILGGRYRGPLHGVPISVKDVFFTQGVRTQGGLKSLSSHVPELDASAIQRLRRAGAVIVGKTYTTEGAMDGYHPDFPVPRNPWARDCWPGVSSSGSGVAVAAGLCFASLGTDTGGSIRMPAAANGVVGMKPTRGAISTHGMLPLAPSLDDVGVITRSVADAALVLNELTSFEHRPLDLEGVRIGYDDALNGNEALQHALHVFDTTGVRLVSAKLPPLDPLVEIWYTLASAEAERIYTGNADYGHAFQAFLDAGRCLDSADYGAASEQRKEWVVRSQECFRRFDLLALPALPGPAFRYDPQDAYGSDGGIPSDYLAAMNRLMIPWNLNGYPALALPYGASVEGIPVGLQLVGRPDSEPLVLHWGRVLETASPWGLRRPNVEKGTDFDRRNA
jgi:amidase